MRTPVAAELSSGRPDNPPTLTVAIDVVIVAVRRGELALCLVRDRSTHDEVRWTLPWAWLRPTVAMDVVAREVAARIFGAPPATFEQAVTLGPELPHPGAADVSVGLVALLPGAAAPIGAAWHPFRAADALPPRHQAVVAATLTLLRRASGDGQLPFRLLPPAFTLAELQRVHELLLGRSLHKASFRRTIEAAGLVEPTDEWRGEGRGRPARLFRRAAADGQVPAFAR